MVAGSHNHQFDITFPVQTDLGHYSLVIGPTIADWSGNLMNQHGGSISGEATGAYTASFTLVAASAFNARFDFGTPTSPVAAGATQVTPATIYSAAQGYGWQSGTVSSRDYTTVADLTTQDFNYTSNGTFAVDVPNETYTVTVTMGSGGFAKSSMGVFLEGAQVDSVNTAAGQYAVKTYVTTITNGQLDVGLRNLGGDDPVINALTISAA